MKGQSPKVLLDPTRDLGQSQLVDQISPSLRFKLRCQALVAQCCDATLENGVRAMSPDQERALDIILRTYERQIEDLEPQALDGRLLSFCFVLFCFVPFFLVHITHLLLYRR